MYLREALQNLCSLNKVVENIQPQTRIKQCTKRKLFHFTSRSSISGRLYYVIISVLITLLNTLPYFDIHVFHSRKLLNIQPLLAHLSRRLIGELIVYQWSGVRRPSVRPSSVRPSSVVVHNAQRSSSPKPLVRSKPNFMWSFLG